MSETRIERAREREERDGFFLMPSKGMTIDSSRSLLQCAPYQRRSIATSSVELREALGQQLRWGRRSCERESEGVLAERERKRERGFEVFFFSRSETPFERRSLQKTSLVELDIRLSAKPESEERLWPL